MSRDDPRSRVAPPVPPPLVTGPTLVSGIVGRQLTYWSGTVNHCPGCGRTSWLIGRFSAECSFCRTALALEHSGMLGVGTFQRNHHHRAA